jgi:hypothetical protein
VVDAHGTHVAGIIAATRDNRRGVAGATDRATLMTVKFIGTDGGPVSRAVQAISYASANGAKVINASWGGPDNSQALQQAIAASPAVVVAAAGNEGKSNDAVPEFPASYALSNVISVAAIDNVGRLAPFSNRGALTVDVGAPGADIGSTVPPGLLRHLQRHVHGGAARHGRRRDGALGAPDLTAGEVVSLLKSTVQPLESLRLTTTSGGLIDAEAAVRAALAGAAPVPEPNVVTPPTGPSEPAQAQPEQACPDGIPSATFRDVVDNVHADAIDCAVWYELVRGTTATTFSPAVPVTRGQVASLLAGLVARAGRLPATAPNAFTDDEGSPHEANINKLASLGIISGVGDRRFAPERAGDAGPVRHDPGRRPGVPDPDDAASPADPVHRRPVHHPPAGHREGLHRRAGEGDVRDDVLAQRVDASRPGRLAGGPGAAGAGDRGRPGVEELLAPPWSERVALRPSCWVATGRNATPDARGPGRGCVRGPRGTL